MQAVLYSRDNCQWCDRVRQLLNSVNISYTEYKYGVHFSKEGFYNEFGEGATFPQVVLNSENLGGAQESIRYMQKENICCNV